MSGDDDLMAVAARAMLDLHRALGLPIGTELSYDGERWTLDGRELTQEELLDLARAKDAAKEPSDG